MVDTGRPEVGSNLETGGLLPGKVQYLSSMLKLDSSSASASFSNSANSKLKILTNEFNKYVSTHFLPHGANLARYYAVIVSVRPPVCHKPAMYKNRLNIGSHK